METQEREVEYYETEDGKNPFREWFSSLKDRIARNKIDARIRRVEFGNLGHCEPVGEGVRSLRSTSDPVTVSTSDKWVTNS